MKYIASWLKTIVLWLIIGKNRRVALSTCRKLVNIANVVAKTTQTKKDDTAVNTFNRWLNVLVSLNGHLGDKGKKELAKAITSDRSEGLNQLGVSYTSKGDLVASLRKKNSKFSISHNRNSKETKISLEKNI